MGRDGVERDGYIVESVLVLGEVGGRGGLGCDGNLQETVGIVWEGVDLEDRVSLVVTWCLGEQTVFGLLRLFAAETGVWVEGRGTSGIVELELGNLGWNVGVCHDEAHHGDASMEGDVGSHGCLAYGEVLMGEEGVGGLVIGKRGFLNRGHGCYACAVVGDAGDGVVARGEIERWGAIVGIGTLLVDPGNACAIGVEDGYVEMCRCIGEGASGREGLLLEGCDAKGDEGLGIVGGDIAEI